MSNILTRAVAASALGLAALGAYAQSIPTGTEVRLVFDQAVSSKTAKPGDKVKLHVADDVSVNGKTYLKADTPVTGVISSVKKRAHFGQNARLQLTLLPVHNITLSPKTAGKSTGSRPDHAAEAAGAGAVVLGPIGLLGGYFVVGKSVEIKVGDPLVTEVVRSSSNRR
jgi:hypothetical protein